MKRFALLLAAVALLLISAGMAMAAPTTLWVKSTVHSCAFSPDDTIRVDVMLNSVNEFVDDAGFVLSYPADVVSFIRAERGALISAWPGFDVTVEPVVPPLLVIDASGPTALPVGSSGQFVRLVFMPLTCATPGKQSVEFCPGLRGDLVGAVPACGTVEIYPEETGHLGVETFYQTCGSALGDTVEIDVRIEGSSQDIDAAGLDIIYDPSKLEYVGHKRGNLTTGWEFFDAARVLTTIRVGGFTQTAIPSGTTGVFVTLRFLANCCAGNADSPLCAQTLVDDFAGMTSECGNVHCIALKTQHSSWGYI
jgi:hypothetical protein